LQSGQFDAGFFYSTETADLHVPQIKLPADIELSARYTVTVLRDAPNPAGAAEFVDFLLGTQGQKLMQQHGLDLLTPSVTGDTDKIPPAVRSALHTTK
jgi:molybdate/tungstate transport system substrate-binding protein